MREDYYFQMFYDDLPIWGFVGKMEKIPKPHGTEHRYYLFTHGAATRRLPQLTASGPQCAAGYDVCLVLH